MASNEYHFVTQWRAESTVEEIFEVLAAVGVPACDRTRSRAGRRRGQVMDLYTKGWLPYRLRWQLRITDVRRHHGFAL